MPETRILTDTLTKSGECPLWDVDDERLYWIDNAENTIFRCTADGREVTAWRVGMRVTSIARRSGGGLVLVHGQALARLDLESGETVPMFELPGPPSTPFNDATVDREGRLLVGSVDATVFGPPEETNHEFVGGVVAVDGALSHRQLVEGIAISNGPALSADGTTLYCNDSWQHLVEAYDYDGAAGRATNRRVIARFEDDVFPDGATVDAEGALWVAAFGAGEIRRYLPDGSLDRRVAVPVGRPTSVMFGGPGLDVLYVTSQRDDHGGTNHTSWSPGLLDGRVFAIHGLGVVGLPETRFLDDTTRGAR